VHWQPTRSIPMVAKLYRSLNFVCLSSQQRDVSVGPEVCADNASCSLALVPRAVRPGYPGHHTIRVYCFIERTCAAYVVVINVEQRDVDLDLASCARES
jgi:hypothetical protein